MYENRLKEIKRLIKKKQYSEIVEYIVSEQNQPEFNQIVEILKKEEVFVDQNGEGFFEQYILSLRNMCPIITDYCDEVEIVNLLFVQERKMQRTLQSIPKKKRLSNLLFSLNTNYLLALKKFKSLKPQKDANQDSGITLDGVALLYNTTFKSILYDHDIWKNNSFSYNAFDYIIDFSKLEKCHEYIQLSSITNAWDIVYKDWKQGFVKICKQDDKIVVKHMSAPELTWLKLSKAKLQIYDYIKEVEISNIANQHPQFFSNELNSFYESIAWGTIKAYLHTDDLDMLVDGVPIRYWIKTYSILIRYSKKVNFINSIYALNFVRTFLSRKCFLRKQKVWVTFLVKNGVPSEYADKIFECLIYDKRSSDLYDFPFVKVKNKYMIIPSLLHIAHPGELLKSRFRQNDFNISEKGKSFEIELRKLIARHNIPVIQIRRKYCNGEYECDIAFLLDDTLFLCECKDNGDKYIFNYIADFYRNDIIQSKRIFDFYENHMEEIEAEFACQSIKIGKIKHVEKLLIYNTVFHSIIEENGIKVVDSERFISFFRRGDLDRRICELYNGPLDCLLGKITYFKLIKYFKANCVVCKYDKIIRIDTERFKFGELSLDIEVERCNNIDRDELFCITNPWFAEAKEFLADANDR